MYQSNEVTRLLIVGRTLWFHGVEAHSLINNLPSRAAEMLNGSFPKVYRDIAQNSSKAVLRLLYCFCRNEDFYKTLVNFIMHYFLMKGKYVSRAAESVNDCLQRTFIEVEQLYY